MPAQQTTGRVNLLILYGMACSLNTRIGKKFKINSKMMRKALFSKQLQVKLVEPCWNGLGRNGPFAVAQPLETRQKINSFVPAQPAVKIRFFV
jgi:hypothetical protein